jgi:hypothetical protein
MSGTFVSDLAVLREWWAGHSSSVGGEVRRLWFGLTVLVGDDEVARHTMYVAGTPSFDSDYGGEWACEYVWEPTDRYLRLDGLGGIDQHDWQGAVDHAVALVRALRPWESDVPGLSGVAVGFDDGDVVVVWASA